MDKAMIAWQWVLIAQNQHAYERKTRAGLKPAPTTQKTMTMRPIPWNHFYANWTRRRVERCWYTDAQIERW